MLPVKDRFHIPEGLIYLDGNSLGPLPKSVPARVGEAVQKEWGQSLIRGWNSEGWMAQPARLGDRIGDFVGAPTGTTVLGDTLSLKVYQALAAALSMRPTRKVILSDTGNFPTDLYMAEGLSSMLGRDHELRLVDPTDVTAAITDEVAVVMLTHVDYRTGRMHDMNAITQAAHNAGAVMIWDLAHSAGAVPVDLTASHCDFAVGCTYKYLNGGPGAPAFIYVRPDLIETIDPALSGWLGHDAPFAFEPGYRPAPSIERMRVGTPPVLQMTALEAALDVWDGITMQDIRAASIALCDLFIAEVENRCPELTLVSPRDANARGSQVSFAFDHGYATMQALIAAGVIGDFRAPNIMRFGFTPLFIDAGDVTEAAQRLEHIIKTKAYEAPEYQIRNRVT
ncbi:kynureninase [Shimia ponticola]|uniref:kynureninase n=1 Tax=Shimia ponticola TaxID=2582893 RepID=UPI0011BE4618|nr:kynureninase [Shimia ponticola]